MGQLPARTDSQRRQRPTSLWFLNHHHYQHNHHSIPHPQSNKVLKEAADRAVPLEELSLCVWLWRGMLWGGDGEDMTMMMKMIMTLKMTLFFRWTKSWIEANKLWPSQPGLSSSEGGLHCIISSSSGHCEYLPTRLNPWWFVVHSWPRKEIYPFWVNCNFNSCP